ncbi:hypothetical protein LOCC1_G002396 [Lachnellula occidentalis]|uniref:Uncharacterized protein n=1 Tax=Lachnellula occidentalis TaxID=215460 RepID=A0A8H8S458_9HELO|nr:hypothetical protein LOCC1_G002396 [Lachnellula occidentalis]
MNHIRRKPAPQRPDLISQSDEADLISPGYYQAETDQFLKDNASPQHCAVDPKTSKVHPQIFENDDAFVHEQSQNSKLAQWGIRWHREPVHIFFFFVGGVGLAVGHHFLYAHLEGRIVSDDTFSQEAIKLAGNAFVVSVLAAMKVAIKESYNQYAWTLVKKKPLQVKTLNNLFSLTSQLSSFWSFHLIREAWLAYLLGALPWLIFLGGLFPAATLSVAPASRASHNDTGSVPLPEYNSLSWAQAEGVHTDNTLAPSALLLKVATETAFNAAVLPPPAPSFNSSFSVQFYGPTVQCNSTTSAEQTLFDVFTQNYQRESSTFTAQNLPAEDTVDNLLVMSSFNPTADAGNLAATYILNRFNNWNVSDITSRVPNTQASQLWLQSAERAIICSVVNASFEVTFNYTNGNGRVTHQHIQIQPNTINAVPLRTKSSALALQFGMPYGSQDDVTGLAASSVDPKGLVPYVQAAEATFLSLTNILNGNVTLVNASHGCVNNCGDGHFALQQSSSRILQTGLKACDEIANNYWYRKFGHGSNFASSPNTCRNRTLDRAIEDLANNITISTLSSTDFTYKSNGRIDFLDTHNVYVYNRTNLIISYGTVIIVSLAAVCIGVASLIDNGVYHYTNFSAFMATTRNRDLDIIARGYCLGDAKGIEKQRLMFGMLGGGVEEYHAAFGLPGSVSQLEKGAVCS